MKQVKTTRNQEIVLFSELTPDCIIGFCNNREEKYKGFLIQHRPTYSYEMLAVDGLTGGNRWNVAGVSQPNFTQVVEFLKRNDFKVYVFDSTKELLKWLAE